MVFVAQPAGRMKSSGLPEFEGPWFVHHGPFCRRSPSAPRSRSIGSCSSRALEHMCMGPARALSKLFQGAPLTEHMTGRLWRKHIASVWHRSPEIKLARLGCWIRQGPWLPSRTTSIIALRFLPSWTTAATFERRVFVGRARRQLAARACPVMTVFDRHSPGRDGTADVRCPCSPRKAIVSQTVFAGRCEGSGRGRSLQRKAMCERRGRRSVLHKGAEPHGSPVEMPSPRAGRRGLWHIGRGRS